MIESMRRSRRGGLQVGDRGVQAGDKHGAAVACTRRGVQRVRNVMNVRRARRVLRRVRKAKKSPPKDILSSWVSFESLRGEDHMHECTVAARC